MWDNKLQYDRTVRTMADQHALLAKKMDSGFFMRFVWENLNDAQLKAVMEDIRCGHGHMDKLNEIAVKHKVGYINS